MKRCVLYFTGLGVRIGYSDDGANASSVKQYWLDLPSKKEQLPHNLKKFLKENEITPEFVSLYLLRSDVAVRYLKFPSSNPAEIARMAEFEAVNLFPVKQEELIISFYSLGQDESGLSEVFLVAALRDKVVNYITILKQAGLMPDEVGVTSLSFTEQLKTASSGQEAVICIEDGIADMVFLDERKLILSRAWEYHGQAEWQDIVLKDMSASFALMQEKGFKVRNVVVCGKSINEQLVRTLQEKIPVNIKLEPGLGLLTVLFNKDAKRIDLMPREFKMRKIKERRMKMLVYCAALLVFNIALAMNILFMQLKGKQQYSAVLDAEIKQLDAKTASLQKQMVVVELLRKYRNSTRFTLGLLSDLYRLAPEGILLNSLDISGERNKGSLVVSGQAASADMVLGFANALKNSGFISKTDVTSMSRRRSGPNQVVDFEIKAYF